jgi:para-aminobenzoate synthetase / 4-amino-4-deoxychorismate lyase
MQAAKTKNPCLPPNTVVIHDAQQHQWLCFQAPVQVLVATSINEVMSVLNAVQQQIAQHGYYGAGFVSYEASPAFDRSFITHSCDNFPLAWFGLYTQPQELDGSKDWSKDWSNADPMQRITLDWEPSISRSQYQQAIHKIKTYIAKGLTYQVNFSFRLQSSFSCDPFSYFTQLVATQPGNYGAFINLEEWAICCASPELFFQVSDPLDPALTLSHRRLHCRPMKGTAPRGLTSEGDRALATALRNSEKNQAENLMIVDMIRNDMGRIAKLGSVQVQELFAIEQYPTLWQMTSPVDCLTQANLAEIFQALFPCASITGAPKSKTTQIIAELETTARRIYTGTIGFIRPTQAAQFNVAIRTVLIDKAKQIAEYGVGGGIVWDSVETDEFAECCTKAKVLTQQHPQFSLLESLLWTPQQGYFLLDLHLQRLQQSADYFAFKVNLEAVQEQLQQVVLACDTSHDYKVRLLVAPSGEMQVTTTPLNLPPHPHLLKVQVARSPIDSSNVFLYHKTTHRVMYEQAKQECPHAEDVLLWNERGELTESCIANLVVEWDGQWYTPPIACGLLAGTYRTWLLQQGKVKEKILRYEDLQGFSRIFLINSVRQIQEAVIF